MNGKPGTNGINGIPGLKGKSFLSILSPQSICETFMCVDKIFLNVIIEIAGDRGPQGIDGEKGNKGDKGGKCINQKWLNIGFCILLVSYNAYHDFVKYHFLVPEGFGCSDGSIEQVFQIFKMVGCDGRYTRSSFRLACSSGWHVATASEYFKFGGKTVIPTTRRFVDVTWDSSGKETSLDNWQGYYDSSNSGVWNSISKNSDCLWSSTNEQCTLSFVDKHYGQSYGCHCRGSNSQGVVCVKDEGMIIITVY